MVSHSVELIIGLLAAVAAIALLAEKLKVPYPILLVIGGLVLSLIPGLPRVEIDPSFVFMVFLPPLLFQAGFQTSWRDFKANIRPIMWLAVGLVLVTTAVVAGVAHWLIPEITLAAAFTLGAIVSPPDAIAATAITERLRVPRRIITVLDGESLVNDATALVAYAFAIESVRQGHFFLPSAVVQFVYVALGGIAVGLVVGWVTIEVRRRVHAVHVEGIISILTPYLAYLPAEAGHVSGVLAVVTAGILLARYAPKVLTAESRVRINSMWDTLVFLLNGAIFILIGLHLPIVVGNLTHTSWPRLFLYGGVISLTAIAVRVTWVFTVAKLVPKLPLIKGMNPPPSTGALAVVSWAGMRGIVSLAAALGVPHVVEAQIPFPARDMIIFLAFSVILATLVIQGLTLPLVINHSTFTVDVTHNLEERQARLDAAHAALSRLQVLELDETIDATVLGKVRIEYEERVRRLGGTLKDAIDPAMIAPYESSLKIRREAIGAEREMITMLRDQSVIGDDVLRRILREIDLEESKLG